MKQTRLKLFFSKIPRDFKLIFILGFIFSMLYFYGVGEMLSSDDFHRILDNREMDTDYFRNLLFSNKSDSFYRPLNHLTFGITYKFFGLNAAPYGYFNFILALASIILAFLFLSKRFQSPTMVFYILASWILAYKPFVMALTWAVGRTTILYAFFLLLALCLLEYRVRGREFWASLCFLLALLSKESAVTGMLVLNVLYRDSGWKRKLLLFACMSLTLGLYFLLRYQAGGMTQANAPEYYQYNYSLYYAIKRSLEYLERLFPGVLLWIFTMIYILVKKYSPGKNPYGDYNTSAIYFTLAFLCISPMLLIPYRSNLYVIFPGLFFFTGMYLLISKIIPRRIVWWPMIISLVIILPLAIKLEHKKIVKNGVAYRMLEEMTLEKETDKIMLYNFNLKLKYRHELNMALEAKYKRKIHVAFTAKPMPTKPFKNKTTKHYKLLDQRLIALD